MLEPRGRFPVVYPLTQTLMAINRRIGMTRAAQRAAIDSVAGHTPNAALVRRVAESVKTDHVGRGDARG